MLEADARNTGNPYRDLATAIVLQAVEDYRKDLIRLKAHKDDIDAKNDAERIERFFRSEWYEILSPLNGDFLIRELKKELGGAA